MATPPARFRTVRGLTNPRWLTEGEGELVGYALDLVKDTFIERLFLGLLARFPQNGPNGEVPPDDARALIGRDRRVVPAISETPQRLAERQLAWLDDRKTSGNPFTLMRKLAEYLGPLPSYRTVDARGNWYRRTAAGVESSSLKQENWNWDGAAVGARWSRFWVIIYPNGLWAANTANWGANTWGASGWGASNETWGSTAPIEHVTTVRAIVADWMPGGTRCVNIIEALDPASFDPTAPEPDGLWEYGAKTVDGVRVRSRPSTARYWDGVIR